ncbi:vitamin B12 dependent methionine synthase activation domain protein [Lactococcus hodotermopsidis]|uniref:Vitamin B12 dependent methionine synthase activation domain protein n=1 Tax=Pseudolactococcus hodotermopsidis TaxID=2709157 RepID=A0A6A0BCF5_9LACT|nr:methionine synthase [Lactococcus hodotermopsidis]GFH42104.1 vitamin B12 dependent methionine synthase activation domain protein [Lactococcus hodotermopsidis]
MQYLPLEKSEVLRYLGYKRKQELTDDLSSLVDDLMLEVQEISNARYFYQAYDFTLDAENFAVHVTHTDLVLQSKTIFNQLKNAKKVVLLAATLGIEIERQIRLYELSEMTKAFILDSACVDYIEKVCDLAEVDMNTKFSNYTLNRRFSPGYGDLSLDIQPQFLKTLAADKQLGLTLTETNLMVPRKSVTAIIGLFDDEKLARPRRKAPEYLTSELVAAAGFNIEK